MRAPSDEAPPIALEAVPAQPPAASPDAPALEALRPEEEAPARTKIGAGWRKLRSEGPEEKLLSLLLTALAGDAPLASALWPELAPAALLGPQRPTPELFAERWRTVLTWLDLAARRDHETRARVEVAQLGLERHRRRLQQRMGREGATPEELCAPALLELEAHHALLAHDASAQPPPALSLAGSTFTEVAALARVAVRIGPLREALLEAWHSGALLRWLEALPPALRDEPWLARLRAARELRTGDALALWAGLYAQASDHSLQFALRSGEHVVVHNTQALLATHELGRWWDALKERYRSGELLAWLSVRERDPSLLELERPLLDDDAELNELLWELGHTGLVLEWGEPDLGVTGPEDLVRAYRSDWRRLEGLLARGFVYDWLERFHGARALAGTTLRALLPRARALRASLPSGFASLSVALLCGLEGLPSDPCEPGDASSFRGYHGLDTAQPALAGTWEPLREHFLQGTAHLWVALHPTFAREAASLLEEALDPKRRAARKADPGALARVTATWGTPLPTPALRNASALPPPPSFAFPAAPPPQSAAVEPSPLSAGVTLEDPASPVLWRLGAIAVFTLLGLALVTVGMRRKPRYAQRYPDPPPAVELEPPAAPLPAPAPPPPPAAPLPPVRLPLDALLRPEGPTLTPYFVHASSLSLPSAPFSAPEQACDGNLRTAWSTPLDASAPSPWLELCFDVPQRFRTLRLTTGMEHSDAVAGNLFEAHAHLRRLAVSVDGRVLREVEASADEHALVLYDLDGVGSCLRLTVADAWPGARGLELALSEVLLEGAPSPDAVLTPVGTQEELSAALEAWLRAQNTGDFAAWEGLYAQGFHGLRRPSEGPLRYVSRVAWLGERRELFSQTQQVRAEHRRLRWVGAQGLVEFDRFWSNAERAERSTESLRFVRAPEGLRVLFEEVAGLRPWDRTSE